MFAALKLIAFLMDPLSMPYPKKYTIYYILPITLILHTRRLLHAYFDLRCREREIEKERRKKDEKGDEFCNGKEAVNGEFI